MIAHPPLKPTTNQCCFVGAIIIQHQMNVEIRRNSAVYLLQEVEKLDRSVPAVALADYAASGNVECRKQARNGVSFVIVGAKFQLSSAHGQHRLGHAESLNPRLAGAFLKMDMIEGFGCAGRNFGYLYDGAFLTSLPITAENVVEIAACDRARWKIGNETFNVS